MADITITETMFRPAKKGGYEKEDVLNYIQTLKETSSIEKGKLQERITDLEKENALITEKNKALENEVAGLKKDIAEKYQSYIDNYDTIGRLIFDAKVQSKQMTDDAANEKQRIISEAEAEKARIISEAKIQENEILLAANSAASEEKSHARAEMDAELAEAKAQYAEIKEKTNALLVKLNVIQRELMSTFKAIHAVAVSDLSNLEEITGEAYQEEDELEIPDDDSFDIEDTHEIDFKQLSEELAGMDIIKDEN